MTMRNFFSLVAVILLANFALSCFQSTVVLFIYWIQIKTNYCHCLIYFCVLMLLYRLMPAEYWLKKFPSTIINFGLEILTCFQKNC